MKKLFKIGLTVLALSLASTAAAANDVKGQERGGRTGGGVGAHGVAMYGDEDADQIFVVRVRGGKETHGLSQTLTRRALARGGDEGRGRAAGERVNGGLPGREKSGGAGAGNG